MLLLVLLLVLGVVWPASSSLPLPYPTLLYSREGWSPGGKMAWYLPT